MTGIYTAPDGSRVQCEVIANDGEMVQLRLETFTQHEFWIRADSPYLELRRGGDAAGRLGLRVVE